MAVNHLTKEATSWLLVESTSERILNSVVLGLVRRSSSVTRRSLLAFAITATCFLSKSPVRRICTQFYMARQARFGGILDHGHEAAVYYRNENKPLAIIRQLTFVAEYHPKQYQAYNFGVWHVLKV
jgi:hypothetical protein